MRIGWDEGIYIETVGGRFYLDPRVKRDMAIVSHGHTDHIKSPGIMTPETKKIVEIRKKRIAKNSTELPLNMKMNVDDVTITLRDAGHVLGSAMVRINDTLYTGDFDTKNGITCSDAKPEECENLIVEATYGSPEMCLPDREKVLKDFITWTEAVQKEKCVVVGAYPLGKAQDVIRIMNDRGIPVVVSSGIDRISQIYKESGIYLDYYTLENCPEDIIKKPHVFVTSSGYLRWPLKEVLLDYWQKSRFVYISGWCNFYNFTKNRPIHVQFPISNHADFNEIIEFVDACSPKRVYTVHGEAEILAKEIKKKLGLNAIPLRREYD